MTYLNYKKKIEFGINEFNLIDSHCKKRKINWFASAWDIDSVKFLNKYNLKYNKIASAMLTNFNLLKAVAKQRKLKSVGGLHQVRHNWLLDLHTLLSLDHIFFHSENSGRQRLARKYCGHLFGDSSCGRILCSRS